MYPYFEIFGRAVSSYGVCIAVGFAVGVLVALLWCKRAGVSRDDCFFSMLFGMIGVIVGGKILYILVNIGDLWTRRGKIFSSLESFTESVGAGFVFYGGLIGALAMVMIYIRKYKLSAKSLLLTLVPSLPLIHAFGRLGCFMAGCCYGCEYSGFGSVVFTHSVGAPNGISLFPSQLAEMLGNAVIFLILVIVRLRLSNGIGLLGIYGILYGILRFTLEFMRGDMVRGIFSGLSTSQWISLAIIIACAVCLVVTYRKSRSENLIKNNKKLS